MEKKWYMLTIVGKDRPGIVAQTTSVLYQGGCQLGEASMLRLGENFTMMLMVEYEGKRKQLKQLLEPVLESLELKGHVDPISARLHSHIEPDVRITVSGADRPGIVARVTSVLAEAGLNILNLDSDVAGTDDAPLYIMQIEGEACRGVDAVWAALDSVRNDGIDVHMQPVDIMMG